MLDVHRLMLLREVSRRGSITAAARALSFTHSAVSQQLSLLERETGVRLLEKHGRGVHLTSAAENLVTRADTVIALLERAEAELTESTTEVRGSLRLAAFTTISRYVVPGVLTQLALQHPQLDVTFRQVEPEEGLSMLTSRTIDVLIADSYSGSSQVCPPDVHADLLVQDPVRAYPPQGRYAERLDELHARRWVVEPAPSAARAWVIRKCREHGFEPVIAYESADLLFHLRLVETGLAAAFLPDLLLRGESADLGAGLSTGTEHRNISLLCRTGSREQPAVVACRGAFAAYL